ncbi:MAG: cytochrome c maturation protein CcmE [Alphaproteobacteria bacterium]
MRRRDQRLFVIIAAGAVLSLAVALTLVGLKDSMIYFVAPSELAQKAHAGQRLRLGGLVVRGSLRHDANGVRFVVTDGAGQTEVHYNGLLPDLFREGQGVVAEGVWTPGAPFEASRVLAKHDERYMPREVAEALKRRGEWRGPQ